MRLQVPDYVDRYAQPYQIEHFRRLCSRVDLLGKSVLEIGSDYHLITARLFAANGADKVVATNLGDWRSPESPPTNVTFFVGDVCDSRLQTAAYDVIYGIAVLEHLPDLARSVEAIARLLKPNGVAYLQGYPLWPSSIGHHVWLQGETGDLLLDFNDRSKNPIPDWAHITLDRAGLQNLLVERGLPMSSAERAANYVYNENGRWTGSCSNRRSASEIVAAFKERFHVEEVRATVSGSNEWFEDALQVYSEGDLRTVGLDLWLHPRRHGIWTAIKSAVSGRRSRATARR